MLYQGRYVNVNGMYPADQVLTEWGTNSRERPATFQLTNRNIYSSSLQPPDSTTSSPDLVLYFLPVKHTQLQSTNVVSIDDLEQTRSEGNIDTMPLDDKSLMVAPAAAHLLQGLP